ncbi:MAG: YfiT family bacillithiol transferase [Cyclobacteriaceae bacterium]|nr:putative metal-dependent hydrolase [Flammeovirgaceae bacterium]
MKFKITVDKQYPIGKFTARDVYSAEELASFIQRIETLPHRLAAEVKKLTPAQWDTPYREGGWTIRQVVHHVADSHTHAYIRTKWALTEDAPTIKAYLEKPWAETPDTRMEVTVSLTLLDALHAKWVTLLKALTAAERKRTFTHPQTGKVVSLETLMGMYAWHGDHHLAHVKLISDF